MQFKYNNPTQVVFGAGSLPQLGEVVRPHGQCALVVTGGQSVKRTGTFDRAVKSLTTAGIRIVECDGIEPNPRLSSVKRGAALARDHGCDVVIALGGGSVMDASKVIAAAVFYEGDPWDMIYHGQANVHVPTQALPIITVPTLAATGSEMNPAAVISNPDTSEKSFLQARCLYPRVTLMDPELTLSVPADQTAYGVCDMITHVTEAYFNGPGGTPLQDRFAEGIILTAIEYGPKAVANGNDLEARTHLQWAATVALNGWANVGATGGYPVHMIEHTVSAHHDVPHGAGLSILNPAWMRFAARAKPTKFVQFAERVFGLKASGPDDLACALAGINQLEAFFAAIGCPTRFAQIGLDDSLFETYAQDTLRIVNDGQGRLPGVPPMSKDDILTVLKAAL